MKVKGVKTRRFTNVNSFLHWSKKERLDWFDKRVGRLVDNLPAIHSNVALYDDKGFELYNQSKETIMAMAKAYRQQVASGKVDKNSTSFKAFEKFLNNVKFYTQPKYKLRRKVTDMRMDAFIENAFYSMDKSQRGEFLDLVNSMTSKERYGFTKSKYFFYYSGITSEGLVEFEDIYGVSLHQAKLEMYLAKKRGLEWKDTKYGKKRLELGYEETGW